jgi:hypothetical protein
MTADETDSPARQEKVHAQLFRPRIAASLSARAYKCPRSASLALLIDVLSAKRLGLLREIVPSATLVAVLLNPAWPTFDTQLNDVQQAAGAVGQRYGVYAGSYAQACDRLKSGYSAPYGPIFY